MGGVPRGGFGEPCGWRTTAASCAERRHRSITPRDESKAPHGTPRRHQRFIKFGVLPTFSGSFVAHRIHEFEDRARAGARRARHEQREQLVPARASTCRECLLLTSSSTPSTRRRIDGVAVPVPRRSLSLSRKFPRRPGRLRVNLLTRLVVSAVPYKFVAAPLLRLPLAVRPKELALLLGAEVRRDYRDVEGE